MLSEKAYIDASEHYTFEIMYYSSQARASSKLSNGI